MPFNEQTESLFTTINHLLLTKEFLSAREYINSLDQPTLVALFGHVSEKISVSIDKNLVSLLEHTDLLGANVVASIHVQINGLLQAFIAPLFFEIDIPFNYAELSLERQRSGCYSIFQIIQCETQINQAINDDFDRARLTELGISFAPVSFLEQVKSLHPKIRFDVLKVVAKYLPEALLGDEQYHLTEASLPRLFALLTPEESLKLAILIAQEVEEHKFKSQFGLHVEVFAVFDRELKITLIEKELYYAIPDAFKDIIIANPDGFLLAQAKLKLHEREIKAHLPGCLPTELVISQGQLNATLFFLDVLTGSAYYKNNADALEKYKKISSDTLLENIIQEPIIAALLMELEQLFALESLRTPRGSLNRKRISSLDVLGRNGSGYFHHRVPRARPAPTVNGLEFVAVYDNDDSFFRAFNASQAPRSSPIDIRTLRVIIARHIDKNSSDYVHYFNGNIDELMQHTCQFKSYNPNIGSHRGMGAGPMHIDVLATLLRRTIIELSMASGSEAVSIKQEFQAKFLVFSDPVFVYSSSARVYSGMRLTQSLPGHVIRDELHASLHELKSVTMG